MTQQIQTLLQTIVAADATLPLFIRTVTPSTNGTMLVGGSASGGSVTKEYVLLDALPQDLRERVITAIKAQMQG